MLTRKLSAWAGTAAHGIVRFNKIHACNIIALAASGAFPQIKSVIWGAEKLYKTAFLRNFSPIGSSGGIWSHRHNLLFCNCLHSYLSILGAQCVVWFRSCSWMSEALPLQTSDNVTVCFYTFMYSCIIIKNLKPYSRGNKLPCRFSFYSLFVIGNTFFQKVRCTWKHVQNLWSKEKHAYCGKNTGNLLPYYKI